MTGCCPSLWRGFRRRVLRVMGKKREFPVENAQDEDEALDNPSELPTAGSVLSMSDKERFLAQPLLHRVETEEIGAESAEYNSGPPPAKKRSVISQVSDLPTTDGSDLPDEVFASAISGESGDEARSPVKNLDISLESHAEEDLATGDRERESEVETLGTTDEESESSPESSPRKVTTMVTKLSQIKTLYDTYKVGQGILDRISMWKGDITKLEVDGVVNAANSGLRGGGGVDGAIHRAAGYSDLQAECRKYNGCKTGDTVITGACQMTHVKNILHTVGPQVWKDKPSDQEEEELISCYETSLELAKEHGLRSVAFPCISTGIYGYPNGDAARSVSNFLVDFFDSEENREKIDRVVLVLFMEIDQESYKEEFAKLAEDLAKDEEDEGDKSDE